MPVGAAFARAKRVTDPLDDKAKARIREDVDGDRRPGCTSSGSDEHEAAVELSGLVQGIFFFSSDGEQGVDSDGDEETADGDEHDHPSPAGGQLLAGEMIRDLVSPPAVDSFWQELQVGATTAAARFAALRSTPASFRRAVMGSLREIGYSAGICNTKWETGGGGLVAGTYEYIDVMAAASTTPPRRHIVDVDFAAEFEIARPTAEYGRLVEELSRVFVGTPEALRRLLGLLAVAARRSLRAREMHLPPWLGPYRRTVDPGLLPPSPPSSPTCATAPEPPAAASFAPARGDGRDVKCRFRAVGFDTAAVIQTAAITR